MSTAARRTRYGLLAVVLVAAATVSLAIANLLASRYSRAWDVTATRAEELSPRTRNLLAELDAPYEIILAADSRQLGPAREQVTDVLAAFQRASAQLRVTRIDIGTTGGATEYQALLARLRERDAVKITTQVARVNETLDKVDDLAKELAALAEPMRVTRDALPASEPTFATNRDAFAKWAVSSSDAAKSLGTLGAAPRTAMAATASSLGIPNLEPAVSPLRKYLAELLEPGLADVAAKVQAFSKDGVGTPAARDLARPIAAAFADLRTRAALAAEALRLERLDLAKVASVLETQEAAIVVGPTGKGVTAIPVSWLFPPVDAPAGMRADIGRRAEELFAVAVESLARPASPVVVLMHGTPARTFAQAREYQGFIERLGLRGIEVVEWATVLDAEPPSTREADPTGKRSVVYVVLNTSALTSHEKYPGPARVEALGRAISRIVQDGAPLLLSITPSDLPTYGQKDPTVSVLPLFGLEADSARPIIRSVLTSQGQQPVVEQPLVAFPGPTPIHGAVKNLRTLLEWVVPLRPASAWAGPAPDPLYRVEATGAWAESQWRDLWVAMHSTRAESLPQLPEPDSSRDDTQGPWTVAAACSRIAPSTGRSQRLVVIGANDWFQDGVTSAQSQTVDGRSVQAYPGNAELFEACVYWLAGQDERVAPSPTARAVAVIGPLGTQSALRWLVLAGLPVGALLLGALWRAVRG